MVGFQRSSTAIDLQLDPAKMGGITESQRRSAPGMGSSARLDADRSLYRTVLVTLGTDEAAKRPMHNRELRYGTVRYTPTVDAFKGVVGKPTIFRGRTSFHSHCTRLTWVVAVSSQEIVGKVRRKFDTM